MIAYYYHYYMILDHTSMIIVVIAVVQVQVLTDSLILKVLTPHGLLSCLQEQMAPPQWPSFGENGGKSWYFFGFVGQLFWN